MGMKDKEKNEAKNKGSKSNNNNLSLWLSVISLVGVATFAVLWICNVRPQSVVSLDSFVGVATGLIGIMVTFAIGWQIVNAMELKSKIAELEQQKAQIDTLQQQLEGLASVLKTDIGHMMGLIALEKKKPLSAIKYNLQALYVGILTSPQYAIYVSQDLQTLTELISEIQPCRMKKEHWEELKQIEKNIKEAPLFSIIQSQYDAIMSDFYKKVSYEE